MLLNVLRALFIVIVVAIVFPLLEDSYYSQYGEMTVLDKFAPFLVGIITALLVLVLEIIIPKKAIGALAGVFFGLLVGLLISWGLASVVNLINEVYPLGMGDNALKITKWVMGVCVCFLVISFVIKTKDDVRFVIPYVEFSRQSKGVRPLVLDTSVIIDGRIADICQAKIFDAPLIVPRFILNELQLVSDSADKLKRNRGRRGLDMLNRLRTDPMIEVKIDDTPPPGIEATAAVDQKLVAFTKSCGGRLVTNDYNLNKVAQLREVDVININDLANCLKPVVLPGETMEIKIVKNGEEQQQGIGYLEDGTMVVVEGARDKIGQKIELSVTSSLQTSAGRMVFGKFERSYSDQYRDNGGADKDSGRKNWKRNPSSESAQ